MKLFNAKLFSGEEDLDTEILFALGAYSVSSSEGILTALVPEDSLDGISIEFGARVSIDEVENRDWVNVWADDFHGVVLTDKTAVVCGESFGRQYEIKLSPQNAFGAGTHPTTALSVALLEKLFGNHCYNSVLDIGCGTGILAIAAWLYGARDVEGFDIDSCAVDTANMNARANSAGVRFFTSAVEDYSSDRTFDVVCANLHTSLIEKNISSVAALGSQGSFFIFSGIIENWYASVEKLFANNGLEMVELLQREGWLAYLLKKI